LRTRALEKELSVVDFRKRLGDRKASAKPVDPILIYEKLDRTSDKGPLRPAQTMILEEWYQNRRAQKDLIIKMHTGQGKTLIGLLILQSKLNEDLGPALYLCPNNHLVDQTVAQAKQFGIACATAPGDLPTEFLESKQILVTSVQKLFNGLTKFKLGAQSHGVGAIVMDDCHACIDAIRSQCVIEIPRTHRAYNAVLTLFGADLKEQGAGTFADICEQKFDAFLAVPYWNWMDRHQDVASILAKDSATEELKYVWPLLKDILRDCVCVISGQAIEISPQLAPLHLFGSFAEADHRIFMSATVTNDAFLVKGIGLASDVIASPMVDKNEKWSGEKMVLIPSLISSDLGRDAMIAAYAPANENRKYGRVALTPSFHAAKEWGAGGALVADKNTIYRDVEALKSGYFEKTLVVANRYDGIDLPDSACRILILDSKPYSETLVDRLTESCRRGSELIATKVARTIEQGLGRSVRGEKDYSAIILTGPDLIKTIRTKKSRQYFSTQTQTQIEIGLEIAELAKEDIASGTVPDTALTGLVKQCIGREDAWKEFYNDRMSKMTKSLPDTRVLTLFTAEYTAETQFQEGLPEKAIATLQDLIDNHVHDEFEKGWYLQEMARYAHLTDKTESNNLQVTAHKKNRYLLKPRDGMKITNISAVGHKRIEAMFDWARLFDTAAELLLDIDDILGRLRFGVAADSFECALDDLGQALGFETQRPDKEWKQGPDNLWALRDNQYLLVECKNQVDTNRKEINKDETGQMNNSCAWFRKHYGDVPVKNMMVIWTRTVSQAAGFNEPVEILTNGSLNQLAKNVRSFFGELGNADLQNLSTAKIQTNLKAYKLTIEDLLNHYAEMPKQL
jgi:replicative superfamily II helicase